jgi:hypothetical protein
MGVVEITGYPAVREVVEAWVLTAWVQVFWDGLDWRYPNENFVMATITHWRYLDGEKVYA